MKKEFPEDTEFTNRIIWYLSSSGAFLTENTNPNMGLHDHVGVIGTVSDCQSDFVQSFDKFDDFGLLGRSDSAEDQRVDSWNDVKQVIFTVYEW